MRSGTCPFISPFMDKRIFLPKESTRHSSLDKKTMKNNNNLVQCKKKKNKKFLSCRTAVCQRELVMGKVIRDHMRRCIYCSSTTQNKM